MKKESNPQISLMHWMFEDIRKITLDGVSHLTKEQLFTPPIEGEYPIGAYLMHFAECDLGWLQTISGQKVPDEIKKRSYYSAWFDVPKEDFNPPKEPLEVKEYIDVITLTRNMFLDHVLTLSDKELDEIVSWKGYTGQEQSASKKWIIYHLLEHEAHTRGQIFMLIRKAGWKKSK